MPAIYVAKYNRFVDNIIGRINRILGKSYDPVRVKIQPHQPARKNIRRKTMIKNINNKRTPQAKDAPLSNTTKATNKFNERDVARSQGAVTSYVLISKTDNTAIDPVHTSHIREATSVAKKRKRTKSKSKKNKNKISNKNGRKAPKARAMLFGLSSLRRAGDVDVTGSVNFTTVKTNFVLGPLTLRVEKEVCLHFKNYKVISCVLHRKNFCMQKFFIFSYIFDICDFFYNNNSYRSSKNEPRSFLQYFLNCRIDDKDKAFK